MGVNLYSDTQTRPTEGMRQAMARAEVGDEQRGLDPTVNALQERVAQLLGQEAALFLPTGTLCNIIATRLHVRPGGDEVLMHHSAHPFHAEAGGPAAISGATLHPLDGDGGIVAPEAFEAAIRPTGDRYGPRTRLLWVEQTANLTGGRVWPLETVRGVLDVARRRGLRAHLDGARLLNAVTATGVPADGWATSFDTAWLDFSKGLGAPAGACLAGSAEMVEEAWRYKQMLGGALRQAGVLAAAALYALDHHVERLAQDHANARVLAAGLAELEGIALDPSAVETNIVICEVADAGALASALARAGVQVSTVDDRRVRMITHLDVDLAGVGRALDAVRAALA